MRQVEKLIAEYDRLKEQALRMLSERPTASYFDELRSLIDQMEEIDRSLTTSSVVRTIIDVPENQ